MALSRWNCTRKEKDDQLFYIHLDHKLVLRILQHGCEQAAISGAHCGGTPIALHRLVSRPEEYVPGKENLADLFSKPPFVRADGQ